jgi:hypothetical protein
VSIFDLTVVPNSVDVRWPGNTGLFPSPLIASAQTVDRGGLKVGLVYNYSALRGDVRADLMGTIAALEGQSNRLRVPIKDNPKRGAYGGTPLVIGGSQTGKTLDIDGCTANISNWGRKGDWFSVAVNGEHELKMLTADANTDGDGETTLSFVPRLRDSPADNAVIFVEDGVLSIPRGIFVLASSTPTWSSRPGHPSKITALSLDLIEDVFATQA